MDLINIDSLKFNLEPIPNFLVLLSTYNGEHYVSKQISSIFNQENVRVSLIVRDDGSTDGTLIILKEMAANFPITIIEGTNIGSTQSYFELLRRASTLKFEFIAFADQDDYWHKNKLSVPSKIYKETEFNMYASKRNLWVSEKKHKKIFPKQILIPSFLNSCFENICAGCTIVVSRKFFESRISPILSLQLDVVHYDSLLYTLAVDAGNLFFDSNAYLDYRLHNANQVGISKSLVNRANNLHKYIESQFRYIDFLMKTSELQLSEENRKILLCLTSNEKLNLKRYPFSRFSRFRQNKIENIYIRNLLRRLKST